MMKIQSGGQEAQSSLLVQLHQVCRAVLPPNIQIKIKKKKKEILQMKTVDEEMGYIDSLLVCTILRC